MPIIKTFLHGNLPVELELDNDGNFIDVRTYHQSGIVYMELSPIHQHALMFNNKNQIADCMADFNRERESYDKGMAARARIKEGGE